MNSRTLRRALLALSLAGLFHGHVQAADVTWDIVPADSAVTGGTGPWDLATTNWTTDAGLTNVLWQNAMNDTAIFGGTLGTVTLGAPITAGGLTFNSGYTVAGVSPNILTLAGTPIVSVSNALDTATISAILAGTNGLTKSGAGTLTLSGVNTVTGQYTISAGTLKAGNAAALGGGGATNETIVQSGATLDINGQALTTTEIIRIAGTGVGGLGALVNTGATSQNALNRVELTADATIGGVNRFDIRVGTTPTLNLAGFTLTKVGTNQVSLVDTTITSGNILINAGTLGLELTSTLSGIGLVTIGNAGTLGLYGNTGTVTRDIVSNGGTIANLGVGGTIASNISLTAGTTLTAGGTVVQTLTGIISGSGPITKTGTGTFALNGANTYTGGTSISDGYLSFGTGALPATGLVKTTGTGSLVASGAFADTAAWLSSGRIDPTSTGSLALNANTAGIDLTGFNNLAISTNGAFTLSGTLTPGSNGYRFGGTANTLTVSSLLSGTNALTKFGASTTVLSNTANSYSGGTIVTGGELQASVGTTAGAKTNFGTGPVTANGGATIRLLAGSTANVMTYANNFSLDNATLIAQDGTERIDGTVTIGSAGATLAGYWGAKNLVLAGNVTAAGTVNFRTFNAADSIVVLSGASNFAGNVIQASGGVTVSGTNTTAGTTTINGGTYSVTGNSTLNGLVNVNLAGALLSVPSTGTLTSRTGIKVTLGTFTNNGNVTITGIGASDDATSAVSLAVSNGQIFNQQAGTISLVNFGANGTTNISGGTMNVSGNFYLGEQTAATVRAVNQTGGTLNLLSPTGGAIRISHWNGGATTYTLSGGTLNAATSGSVVNIGWDGPATMTVGGGAGVATLKARGIQLDASGDTVAYSDTLTISNNGVVEVGGGGIAGASVSDKLILNGGTLRGVTNSTWASALSANAATTSTLNLPTGISVTQSGILDNAAAGTINKTGLGTLTLSNAANTFAGTLNLNGGTTAVTGTFSAGVAVNVNSGGTLSGTGTLNAASTTTLVAGGTINPGVTALPGVIGTLNVGNLTATAGELRFDLNPTTTTTGSTFNDLLTASGTTVNLAGVSIMPVFQAAPTVGNTYTLLTSTNAYTGSPVLSSLVSGGNSGFTFTLGGTSTSVTLNVTSGASNNLIWNGDGSANAWNLNTASNWQVTAPNDATFKTFDNVTFTDASANKTVALTGTLLTTGTTVNNSTGNDYTFTGSGILSGSTLTKQGTGKLTLAADVLYSTVTLTAGTLQLGNGGTVGSVSPTAIANSGILAVNRSDSYILNSVISGTGTLEQNGTGTTILTGTNLYSGITTINAGTLQIGNGGAAGSIASSVSITNNGTLAFSRNDTPAAISQIISGSGIVQQNGAGTTILTGANSYSGLTQINSGTLQIGSNGTAGTLGTNNVSIALGATLAMNRSDSITVNNTLSGGGNLTKAGAGVLTLGGTNTYTGGTAINAGAVSITSGTGLGTGPVTIAIGAQTGTTTPVLAVANNAAVTVPNAIALPVQTAAFTSYILKNTASSSTGTPLELSGNITGGSSFVTLYFNSNTSGDNTTIYRLSGTNTFTAGTININRGVLAVASPTALGAAANIVRLDSNANNTIGNLSFEVSGTFANPVTITSGGAYPIGVTGSNIVTLTSPITSALTFNKVNTGTLITTATNVLGANTVSVNGGTLQVGNGGTTGSLGTTGAVTVASGAFLSFNRSDAVTVANVIQGAGNTTFNGSGTTTLSAVNTYTGITTVNAGTVVVTGSLQNNGVANILMAAPDDTLAGNPTLTRPIASGLNTYAGYGSWVTAASLDPVLGNSSLQTKATILMSGDNLAANDLSMQWRTRTTAEVSPLLKNAVLSDVLNLNGTGSDIFVLSMSYTTAALSNLKLTESAIANSGELRLGWRDLSGNWVTAVSGNDYTLSGSPKFAGVTSWADYYNPLSIPKDGSDLSDFLGTYGVDLNTQTVWAVLNHNSEFAVIPEPSTFVLGAVGLLGFAVLRRRRAR